MELPNSHFRDYPVEFKEINPKDFPMFEVNNKEIINPNEDGYINDSMQPKIQLGEKNSVVINAFVGCGKSYAIIQTIKEYYNTTDYLIIVASPYVSLVQQYVDDIHDDAQIPKDDIYNYTDLGRDFDIPYLGKRVQVLTANTLKPFIEANTSEISLHTLKSDCIIPVFSKDNERTIAHTEFIEIAQNCVSKVFPHHVFDEPEVRVSHQIKGRTPDAINKQAKDLLDHERTQYFERMAFIIRIPSIVDTINGNEIALVIGGVRSYNLENLYNKKTIEKFKFFIGFQVKVCCNLAVSSDGFVEEMRVSSYQELQSKILEVLYNFNAEKQLAQMKQLSEHSLTEHQFAQLLGRTRLYQHLPKKDKLNIPVLNFNDGQLNTIAKDYYEDASFSKNENGDINLWNVYNLDTIPKSV